MSTNNPEPSNMSITVISADGLKKPSCTIFARPPRPFISLTAITSSAPSVVRNNGDKEDRVGLSWGDEFRVHVSSSFFTDLNASIHLQLYRKSFTQGWTQLGWCRVPAADVMWPAVDSVKYLSYRLLARDGTRSDGIINLAVKVGLSLAIHKRWPGDDGRTVTSQTGGSLGTHEKWPSHDSKAIMAQTGGSSDTHERWSSSNSRAETSQTVIGVPVKYFQSPTM